MQTLLTQNFEAHTTITLHRPEQKNSFNLQLLQELNQVLNQIEKNPSCHAIVIQGYEGYFCTGIDLKEISTLFSQPDKLKAWTSLYMATLKRLTTSPKIIISVVDGKAFAGGVGIASAADYVIGTNNSQFKLTELCWGLLPAMVAPFLIRRIGFQKAYALALTHRTLSAAEACQIGLLDELSDDPANSLQNFLKRIHPIDLKTLKEFKDHFYNNHWKISKEMEQQAIEKTTQLLQSPAVQARIEAFIQHQILPWKE